MNRSQTIQRAIISGLCAVISASAIGFAWYWYGWRLAVVCFLFSWAHGLAVNAGEPQGGDRQ